MQLTLLESDRSFFHSAEWVVVSVVAHFGVLGMLLSATADGTRLPVTERDARVFFLLPPDRVPASERQAELPRVGKLASGLGEGGVAGFAPGPGPGAVAPARRRGTHSGPRLQELAPAATLFVPDSVYSVLQVDEVVERYPSSAAPVYPEVLMLRGTQGQVEATYVVDTFGRVDTSTIEVLRSDHPLFTQSVRTALADTRFRPARRGGRSVRQLVQQRFSFRVQQATLPASAAR
jgi:TonB family protein